MRYTYNTANKNLKQSANYNIGMGQKIENSLMEKNIVNRTFSESKQHCSIMPLKYFKDKDGNFICPHPGCEFTKRNQSTLHYHMKKHEEQLDHICKICKKQFLQKQTLELHIYSKHPELVKDSTHSEKKFKCPFDNCEFTALTKGNCIIHCLRVHFQNEINNMMSKNNETKTIYCNNCQKNFSSSCAFYYHCKSCMMVDKNEDKYRTFNEILS
jgi:hypothetical protein